MEKIEFELQLINNSFENDIRAMVMAFYPGCHIHVKDHFTRPANEADVPGRVLLVVTQCAQTTLRLYGAACHAPGETQFIEPVSIADSRLRRKSLLKRHLYALLSADTGRTLPWGTLTGIRPTQIPMAMLADGANEAQITAHMREEYFVSDEKIRLATEIAGRERRLLSRLDYQNGYSLYIGIPFCPSTCAYCSFTSYPLSVWKEQTDAYLDALEKELTFIAACNAGRKLDTVYIGGGTPTTLTPRQLTRLCELLMTLFPMEQVLEWSVEAGRPDSITKEKLAALRAFPVTRISINPQTMKEQTLRLIGRRHTTEQTAEAFALARSLGFDNINMDIILGLPDETAEDVAHTLDRIADFGPDSLTVHALAKKRAARLTTQREAFSDTTSVDTQQLHAQTEQRARQMGLSPYYLYRQKNIAGNLENVGYGKEGSYCIYNILIMEGMQSIYAAGAGASTKLVMPDGSRRRAENVKDVGQYISRIDEMIARKKII